MRVTIKFAPSSPFARRGIYKDTLEHITEIHYRYPSPDKFRIAFESDEGTGVTHWLDDIEEFEVEEEATV